jgi:hypothetical protein
VKIGYESKLHGIHNIEHFETPSDRAEELMGFLFFPILDDDLKRGRPKITGC